MKIVIALIAFATFICCAFPNSTNAQSVQNQELTSGSLLKFKARPDSGLISSILFFFQRD
jgi:hypothetical protein